MTANDSIVKKLKEIFPLMEEDFLLGICEGYEPNDIDMDEMVNMVMDIIYYKECYEDNPDFQNNTPIVEHQVKDSDDFQHISGENDIIIQNETLNMDHEIDNSDIPYPEPTVFNVSTEEFGSDVVEVNDILVESVPSYENCGNEVVYNVCNGNKQVENFNESVTFQSNKGQENCSRNKDEDSLELQSITFHLSSAETDIIEVIDIDAELQNDEELSVESCIKDLWTEDKNSVETAEIERKVSQKNIQDNSCVMKALTNEAITTVSECKIKSPNTENNCQNEVLVSHKEKANMTESPTSPSQFDKIESKLSLLRKVLPDAHPEFLLEESHKITTQEELLVLISRLLDSRDYPKLEPEDSKVMETFDVTIEEFLVGIPDPVKEFSNNYTRTGYEENAEIYLKSRYKNLAMYMDVKDLLTKNNYNLTDVCQHLDDLGMVASPYNLENVKLHHAASVFFHQEVWYIEHKTEILNFIESVIEATRVEEELNRPHTPTPVEEVFECAICRDDVVDYADLRTCDSPSGHLFCMTCVRRSAEIRFAEGGTSFPCLVNCDGFIPLPTIKEVLLPEMYEKLTDNIQNAELRAANLPGMEYCPFCHYGIMCPQDNIFQCKRPSCLKKSCRICQKEDHSPEMCAIFKEDEETARHIVEDEMSQALIRKCNKCNMPFVKESGCNKMVCNQCGAMMCYLCRKTVKDYTHFNGQGGDNYDRCELFSDESTVHEKPVADSGEQAFAKLIANNPGLNLDRNKVIPK